MKLKICGIQQSETLYALQRGNLHSDYLGFVFAPSRRQVTQEQMIQMLPNVPKATQTVGVFVNPDWKELKQIQETLHLDVIQLHGQESWRFCQQVKQHFPSVKVWKAWHVTKQADDLQTMLPPEAYGAWIDAILLDTYDKKQAGGTGEPFAWHAIPRYHTWCRQQQAALFIAGGLHVGNIPDLIAKYQPDGVDVSSGVETEGQKDIAKMTQLIERVNHIAKPGIR